MGDGSGTESTNINGGGLNYDGLGKQIATKYHYFTV